MVNSILKKVPQVSSELAYRVDLVKHTRNLPELSSVDLAGVEALRSEGNFITSLDTLALPSTPQLLEAAQTLLPQIPTIPHKKETAYARATSAQIMGYPDIFCWGLEERLLNIVETYIGLPVAYHGVSFRRDLADGNQIGTRQWHIDIEDRRMIKVIVYMNQVNSEGGPFEYIPKPLTPSARSLKYAHGYLADEVIEQVVPASQWVSCQGSAGTVIFTDTCSVFHRGKVPTGSDRCAMFFSYTSRQPKNPGYIKSGFSPVELSQLTSRLSDRQKKCVTAAR